MAKNMPNASDVAARWQSGFANSGTKWTAGVNSVDRAPGIDAAASKDRYLAGVQANAEKFASNVSRVTLAEWKNACTTKGASRLASGATAGMPKYQAKIGPVLSAIGQIRDGLPPRGDIMTNLTRMQQMALELHNRAQQGW
jgi:hypothetical protein